MVYFYLVIEVYHKDEASSSTRCSTPKLHIERRSMYDKYLKLLEEKGVTTYQVCKATGISESVISMWGKRTADNPEKEPKLSIDNIMKLAKFFNVSIGYFVGE